MDNKVKIFEDRKIRTVWNEETEEWRTRGVLEYYVIVANLKIM